MILYVLSFVIGVVSATLSIVMWAGRDMEEQIIDAVKAGKRVILAVDNDVVIYEHVNGKIRATRATAKFLDPLEVSDDTPFSS